MVDPRLLIPPQHSRLHRNLADDLARYLAGFDPDASAFPLPGRGADMLKVDLEAAGFPYRDEASCRSSISTPCTANSPLWPIKPRCPLAWCSG